MPKSWISKQFKKVVKLQTSKFIKSEAYNDKNWSVYFVYFLYEAVYVHQICSISISNFYILKTNYTIGVP